MRFQHLRFTLACSTMLGFLSSAAIAQESDAPTTELGAAISETKPLFDFRVRYEMVEQDGIADTANALTYRARVGLETGKAWDTSFLMDFDLVDDLIDDFNSTTNGKTQYPVVADPQASELNRVQLTNTTLPDTTVVVGRQRIIFDDARFVGNVGWRQNEQTFDAVRVTNASFGDLTVDAVYVDQVNRIFGDESAQGRWDGDTYLLNVSYPTPIGKLTGFGYLIDVDQAGGANSSDTYGATLAGDYPAGEGKISYLASFATQKDGGSNNLDYQADYYHFKGGYDVSKLGFSLGYEVLGGDAQRGFQTPLATAHAFQGWADKFLSTPNQGVKDLYASALYKLGDVGPLSGVKFVAVYHDFSAESTSADWGSELDLLIGAKWKSLGFTLKYADYSADEFSVDTQKFWFQIDYSM